VNSNYFLFNPKFEIFLLGLILFLGIDFAVIQTANSAGTWNGQDTIRVPLSWCPVTGSEVVSNPNIPNPWGGVDTTTDDVLWRRHERATDYIYIHQAGITFRSAINDALHTSLNFDPISDPDPTLGSPGNLTTDPSHIIGSPPDSEMNKIINLCNESWANRTMTGVVNGIPVINIRRFVDIAGNIEINEIGSSACELKPWPSLECVANSGYVIVIDNCYTALGATCGDPGWNNDRNDQNLAHELGHALGLGHRNVLNALMAERQQENGDFLAGSSIYREVSNFELNPTEVSIVRDNARLAPNSEIDPDNLVVQGDIVRGIRVDKIQDNIDLLPFEDISTLKVTLNKNTSALTIDQELFGIFPNATEQYEQNNVTNINFWTLIDADNSTHTGTNMSNLKTIGVPPIPFDGVDMVSVALINVTNNENSVSTKVANSSGLGTSYPLVTTGKEWIISDNGSLMNPVTNGSFAELKTMSLEVHYRANSTETNITDHMPLFNFVRSTLNNSNNLIQLNKPFAIQYIVETNGKIQDKFEDEGISTRPTLELKQPYFPQCVASTAEVGKNATVTISGLLPNREYYVGIGPKAVAEGMTDNFGNSTIQFRVPGNTTAALHLLTVGLDKTALTADCELLIEKETKTQTS
jgi:hypothetical protein